MHIKKKQLLRSCFFKPIRIIFASFFQPNQLKTIKMVEQFLLAKFNFKINFTLIKVENKMNEQNLCAKFKDILISMRCMVLE